MHVGIFFLWLLAIIFGTTAGAVFGWAEDRFWDSVLYASFWSALGSRLVQGALNSFTVHPLPDTALLQFKYCVIFGAGIGGSAGAFGSGLDVFDWFLGFLLGCFCGLLGLVGIAFSVSFAMKKFVGASPISWPWIKRYVLPPLNELAIPAFEDNEDRKEP